MKIHVHMLTLLMLTAALHHPARADVVLSGNAPFLAAPSGQQSDASTAPAYTQAFSAPANSVVDTIDWWGYHGADSGGAGYDHFVVTLNDVAQAGTLTTSSDIAGITHYSYALRTGLALTATTLGIINNSQDVEWYWQSTNATGNPNAADGTQVAYTLLGHAAVPSVPEPATPLMLVCGLMVITVARRRGAPGQG